MAYPLFANKTFANWYFRHWRTSTGLSPVYPLHSRQLAKVHWTFANAHLYFRQYSRGSTKRSPILANVHRTFASLCVALILLREIYINHIHTVLRQLVKVHKSFANIGESPQDPRQHWRKFSGLSSADLSDFCQLAKFQWTFANISLDFRQWRMSYWRKSYWRNSETPFIHVNKKERVI